MEYHDSLPPTVLYAIPFLIISVIKGFATGVVLYFVGRVASLIAAMVGLGNQTLR